MTNLEGRETSILASFRALIFFCLSVLCHLVIGMSSPTPSLTLGLQSGSST